MASKSFFNNWIVKNLFWVLVVLVIFFLVLTIFPAIYTRHGDIISVPDFVGLSADESAAKAERIGIRTEVVDSIYVKGAASGSVVRQDPKAGSGVKQGRRIQLVINATTPKKVAMPDLIDLSLRSATSELYSRGLSIGRIEYVEDIATNNVLRQKYQNRDIAPHTMIPCDSEIDLVLGMAPGSPAGSIREND